MKKKNIFVVCLIILILTSLVYSQDQLYFNDFSDPDLSDWTFFKYSTGLHGPVEDPYVKNNRMFIKTRDQQATLQFNGDENWSNYTLENDVRIEQSLDDGAKGINTFVYLNNVQYAGSKGFVYDTYLFRVRARDRYWDLSRRYSDGTVEDVLAKENISVSVGVDYHVKIVVNGTNIKVYFNQVGATETLLTNVNVTNRPLQGGQFGYGGSDDLISVDNVSVYGNNGGEQFVYGTTVIVHGMDPVDGPNEYTLETDQPWTLTMAEAIAKRLGKGQIYTIVNGEAELYSSLGVGGETIIVFDWLMASQFPVFGFSEAAGDVLSSILIKGSKQGNWNLNKLHFIGHSRGAVVSSEAIQRLGLYDIKVIDNIHFTILDSHPWDDEIGDKISDPLSANDNSVNEFGKGVVCWENVTYADNYWHYSGGIDTDLSGLSSILGCRINKNLSDNGINYQGMSHSGVHAWYHGTIDHEAKYDLMGGDAIIQIDPDGSWYPGNERMSMGFNYTSLGGNINLLFTENSIDFSADNTFNENMIFNGDFSKNAYMFSQELAPGWNYHSNVLLGGEGLIGLSHLNYRLKLNKGNESKTHNYFYFPETANKIYFQYRVSNASSDDQLIVQIDGENIGKNIDVNDHTLSFKSKSINVTNFSGGVHTLTFKLVSHQGDINSQVYIDNISFSENHELYASVGCPVNLHVYDSNGNHTGPISDSDWETGIPGSRYFTFDDGSDSPAKTIVLPPAPNGVEYSYKIESQNATDNFSFYLEDNTDATENSGNALVAYKDIPILPNTVVTTESFKKITPDFVLKVDEDGDGSDDKEILPTTQAFPNEVPPPTEGGMEIVINADDEYQLWLNGEEILPLGANALVWNEADKYQLPYIDGENCIAVSLNNRGNVGGLLVEVFVDGKPVFQSNGNWLYNQTEEDGWFTPNFHDNHWQPVIVEGPYPDTPPWNGGIAGFPNPSTAYWINGAADDDGYFRGCFNVDGNIDPPPPPPPVNSNALISINGDDQYDLYLNGTLIGSNSDWDIAQQWPVELIDGENCIEAFLNNRGNTGGLLVEVSVDGNAIFWSRGGWEFNPDGFNSPTWYPVSDLGQYPNTQPWGNRIANFPNPTPAHWIIGLQDDDGDGYYRAFFEYQGVGLAKNQSNVAKNISPNEYYLGQNYPNPFNPSTKISFYLPTPENVIIKIFDVNGKEIKNLTNEFFQTGEHSVQWDGRDNSGNKVSSGIYFYTIKAGQFMQTKKMVFIQ